MIERNQEWADVLRAELSKVWEGYEPKITPAARVDQMPEPGAAQSLAGLSFDELEARRAAVRAARGGARSYGPPPAEGTRSTGTA